MAAQPKTEDFTGYDQHWRSFAWRLGVGIGLIVAGLAAAAATSDLLPQALADFGAFTSLALGTVSGLAFVIPAGLSHGQFRRLHPFVEDFYSEEDRARGAQVLAMRIVAGVALILLGIATHILAEDVLWPRANWIAVFVLGFSAPGTCLLVWGGVSHARFNVAGWNHRADGPGAFTDSPQERAKSEARKLYDLVCALIMQVATLIALGTVLVASVGFADTQGGRLALMLFWVAWPLGGILCGIAWMIIRIRYLKDPTANLSVPPTES